MDVAHWLERLGLAQYAEAFAANAIDTAMLAGLTTDDLKEIGVGPLGHRKRILEAIAALGDAGPPGLAEAPARAPIRTREAERRQLTVMFVDLVGSTALSRRLDPEDMGQILKAYQNAVVGEISRLDGFVAKLMGDGVLAYFGWPKAHEDEAEHAVRAGLAIVAAVARLKGAGEALACRVGIATGLVVVGDLIGEGASQEEAVVGDTPNLAARLQQMAAPGQVVVAEATRRLLGSGLALESLGVQAVKGLADPVEAFRVVGERAVESRFASRSGETLLPMVGREEELALLLRQWREAVTGEGRAVLVVGEAGIGKSRLIRALREAVLPDRPTVLLYQCSPSHAGSPLWPVMQQLTFAARFEPGDDAATRRAKLAGIVAGAERLDLLASLLGIPGDADPLAALLPQERRRRTLQALVEQLHDLAARAPVLVLIEDVHWIDPSTIELLQRTLEAIASRPVLVVLTSRPEAEPKLGSFPHVSHLVLSRLGRAAVDALVGGLLETRSLDQAVRAQILARTDGVPLFVEELTKAILEAAPAGQGVDIPATLEESLLARLDREPMMRSVAQIAACIGREFDHRLLALVADLPDADLASGLEALIRAELVYRRSSFSEASYVFKHALVREVAYGSILKTRRRELHDRIAKVLLQSRHGDVQPEMLAHHFTESGDPRALDYWETAAVQASERYALIETASHVERGLALVRSSATSDPRRELQLQLRLGLVLVSIQGGQAAAPLRVFERARDLALELGDRSALRVALGGLYAGALISGETRSALELAKAYAASADTDEPAAVLGKRMVAAVLFLRGNLVESTKLLGQALDATVGSFLRGRETSLSFIDPRLASLTNFSQSLALSGYPDRAVAAAHQALLEIGAARHFNARAHTLIFSATCFGFLRLGRRTVEGATTAIQLCRQHGSVFWEMPALYVEGVGKVVLGELAEGVRLLQQGLDAFEKHGCHQYAPYFLAVWAEGELRLGHYERSAVILERAFALMQRTEQSFAAAEIERVRGGLAGTGSGDGAKAAERFLAAVETARSQGARLLKLRAARDLAKLWAEQGERRRALDLLTPIYAWFTEGFDFPDLVAAKALLDELR